jgi:hypothetical protein
MNKKSAFVALLLFLLLFMMIGDASGQITGPAPGVSPGNTFTYSFSAFFWNYTNPNAAPPAEMVELNKTESITVTVTNVTGQWVFLNISRRFENGTETSPSEDFVNIVSGQNSGQSSNAWGLIVSPKLDTNNIVYPYGNVNFTINGTMTRTYSFGERETAYSSVNATDLPGTVYHYDNIYFDRATGVMLEWYAEQVQSSSPNEKTAVQWKIEKFDLSTIPAGPNYWLLTAAVVSAVAVSMAIIVFVRKRGKRRRRTKRPK